MLSTSAFRCNQKLLPLSHTCNLSRKKQTILHSRFFSLFLFPFLSPLGARAIHPSMEMLQSCCYCCCYPQKTISSFKMRDGVIPACVPNPPSVAAHSCQFHSTHVSHPPPKMQRLLRARHHRGRCRLGMRRSRLSRNGETIPLLLSADWELRGRVLALCSGSQHDEHSVANGLIKKTSPNRVILWLLWSCSLGSLFSHRAQRHWKPNCCNIRAFLSVVGRAHKSSNSGSKKADEFGFFVRRHSSY